MKVLIAEDSNTMRGIVREMMRRLGYNEIVEAEDGQQAWEQLNQGSFDLLLTDWNMPRMSGLELLQKVRESPDLAAIPVVMLTTRNNKEDIVSAMKAGINNYVTKPVDYDLSYRYCYKYETRADSILCKKSDLQGRISDDEKKAVLEVLESGNLSTFVAAPGEHFLGGKKIREFEKKFAEHMGSKFAVAFNSATSALHAAVVAVGVLPGEEVIVPPYTFTSTATCVLMNNSIPVFSDIKEDIFCLDPKKLDGKKNSSTKAIIPVHLFGHPCDMDEILEFAKKNKLKIIEDCAQAPDAKYKDKKVGTMGDCGIFSFQETKNMMTGEGGMLVTNDENIAKTAQMIRNHGEMVLETDIQRKYKSEILGWGYRMTEIEASLGIVQLSKLDSMNETRKTLANYLTEKLNSIDENNIDEKQIKRLTESNITQSSNGSNSYIFANFDDYTYDISIDIKKNN